MYRVWTSTFRYGRVPEPVREVRDMEAYSHREGLALNAEEIRYLENCLPVCKGP